MLFVFSFLKDSFAQSSACSTRSGFLRKRYGGCGFFFVLVLILLLLAEDCPVIEIAGYSQVCRHRSYNEMKVWDVRSGIGSNQSGYCKALCLSLWLSIVYSGRISRFVLIGRILSKKFSGTRMSLSSRSKKLLYERRWCPWVIMIQEFLILIVLMSLLLICSSSSFTSSDFFSSFGCVTILMIDSHDMKADQKFWYSLKLMICIKDSGQ